MLGVVKVTQLLSASHTVRYSEISAGTDEKAHSFRM